MDGRGRKALKVGVARVLEGVRRDADGIYSGTVDRAADQADEVLQRDECARQEHPDLLREVARHHSVQVMDREVRTFLARIPLDGVVVDIGGGWGWHWRHLSLQRPDVSVVLVDMVRSTLGLAARCLGTLVNDQVFLVHGEARTLPFPSSVFDGYWTVQALQHVPDFESAVVEAHRVLRPQGEFACFSLNRAPVVEALYRMMAKPYHVSGKRPGGFYLNRGSAEQARLVGQVFVSPVVIRYSEILFHPDLKLFTGAPRSFVGWLDARLAGSAALLRSTARQCSFHTRKR